MRRPEVPDSFTDQYLRTALWSSTDNSTEAGGEPLDYHYGEGDFTNDTLATMVADCEDFQRDNADLLVKAYMSDVRVDGRPYDASAAGHDFWLTRNGHGAGFWDRRLPKKVGDGLSNAAKKYGTFYLDVHRGKIHGMPLRKQKTTPAKGKGHGNMTAGQAGRPFVRERTDGGTYVIARRVNNGLEYWTNSGDWLSWEPGMWSGPTGGRWRRRADAESVLHEKVLPSH